ncbi:MAG: hypothetical protein GKR86_03470 [Ilumatobacter sp.]|nr:hypothetical protein [Ilumatobacter sp.]
MAEAAKEAGWDGLFVWKPLWGVEAWIALALAAVRTSQIRLGQCSQRPRYDGRGSWQAKSQRSTASRAGGSPSGPDSER